MNKSQIKIMAVEKKTSNRHRKEILRKKNQHTYVRFLLLCIEYSLNLGSLNNSNHLLSVVVSVGQAGQK